MKFKVGDVIYVYGGMDEDGFFSVSGESQNIWHKIIVRRTLPVSSVFEIPATLSANQKQMHFRAPGAGYNNFLLIGSLNCLSLL